MTTADASEKKDSVGGVGRQDDAVDGTTASKDCPSDLALNLNNNTSTKKDQMSAQESSENEKSSSEREDPINASQS